MLTNLFTGTTIWWLILIIVLVIIELATMGLTTIWFATGAVVAMIASVIGVPVWLQIILFILVSFIMLLFTRPVAVKHFNKERIKTNVETMVGKQAIVVSEIDNLQGIGRVMVDGVEWTGRSLDKKVTFSVGEVVVVVLVEGNKLIVSKLEEE